MHLQLIDDTPMTAAPPLLDTWLADEQAVRQRLAQGPGPGVATRDQMAGLSGLALMQAILDGTLPYAAIAQTLDFLMVSVEPGRAVFQAELTMQRHALDGLALAKALVLCPGFSLRSVAAIYWQALRLKLKGAPFFEHPRHRTPSPKVSTR